MSAVPTSIPGWGYVEPPPPKQRPPRKADAGNLKAAEKRRQELLSEPHPGWITTPEVKARLGWRIAECRSRFADVLETRSRTGKGSQGLGTLWREKDIEELENVVKQTGLSAGLAARVLRALRDGRI